MFVITPNEVLATAAMRPGSPRLAWLKMLNTSMRNCRRASARQRQVLDDREVGVAEARADDRRFGRGCRNGRRRRPTPAARTPIPTRTNQRPLRSSDRTPTLLNHCVVEPRIAGSPMRSGRSVLFTPVKLLIAVTMFTGLPVCACVTMAELPAFDSAIALEGQLVDGVDDETVPHVEVRRPFAVGDVVAVLNHDGAGAQRVRVGRLRQRVRRVELQPVRSAAGWRSATAPCSSTSPGCRFP